MTDYRVCNDCGEFYTFHNGNVCPRDSRKHEWEKLRNESWQKQELFVNALIKENLFLKGLIETIANDKYSRSSGFKNIDGTVGEFIARSLDDLK